jgi:signal transduction histidine kinase
MTILLVDDQPGIRLMLKTLLNDAGYADVTAVESAQQAFDLLGICGPSSVAMQIDLILMDITMPEIDGVAACRTIKESSRVRDIPVIMVTGWADSNKLNTAFAAGAVDYITKPPNAIEMLARVRSALESKREMDRRKSFYVNDLEQKNQESELANIELERKNLELEEASLAKTQILTTATHELKTPLTSIIGYVDRLLLRKDTVGELNQKQVKYLETVQKNAYRLKALVDDLLDVSRIEAGGLELSLMDLDVLGEIEETVQSMHSQISDKKIVLALEIPANIGMIKADRLRFAQVMTNLLSNACKYSPVGSKVAISAFQQGQHIQFDISDAGIGISEADQAKLFTKFFRADNTSTREQSGTGLGLYITRHLIEAHRGTIWTESAIGKGTTIHFTWQSGETRSAHGPVPSRSELAGNA